MKNKQLSILLSVLIILITISNPFLSVDTTWAQQTNYSTFADVPSGYWAYDFIESLYQAGITGGCDTDPLRFCPENSVTRAEMALFILRGMYGGTYQPPGVGASTGFLDVPTWHWAAPWIKQLAAEGITTGCGGGNYCPSAPVSRDQMALFILRGIYGGTYQPPPVGASTGFHDVPTWHWAAPWIKQLAAEGVTTGCGGGYYCPNDQVSRAQMAVFLVRAFVDTGFYHTFEEEADGWDIHSGEWKLYQNSFFITDQGTPETISSVSYKGNYTNFDYRVALWRTGSNHLNRVVVRGTPLPLSDKYEWHSGYAFQYTISGHFSVWKMNPDGSINVLQNWTTSTAIEKGGAWNHLRVVANGSSLYFFVNGTLLWSGNDDSYPSGRVGIGMFVPEDPLPQEILFISYATLNIIRTGGAPEFQSPELFQPQ